MLSVIIVTIVFLFVLFQCLRLLYLLIGKPKKTQLFSEQEYKLLECGSSHIHRNSFVRQPNSEIEGVVKYYCPICQDFRGLTTDGYLIGYDVDGEAF